MAKSVSSLSSAALAAKAWVDVCEPLDRQLCPLGLQAMAALAPRSGDVVLDVGCGTGQTALQLLERVAPGGHVIGVDIAALVLDVARKRAGKRQRISFIEDDAASLGLPSHSLDACFSRFGVMAFPEPVSAFTNLHRMLKPKGRLAFVCWRSLAENELDILPLHAAGLEHLLDPTPFSFEHPDVIAATLETAGFSGVAVRAHDELVSSGDLEAMTTVLLAVGPLGKIIRETPALRAAAEPRVRAALARMGDKAHVALRAATWVVTARA